MDDPHRLFHFWWLKRLAPLSVLMLGLMAGSYWWVGYHAKQRLAEETALWSGMPVLQPHDTGGTPADMADPSNPAFHLRAAITALPAPTPAQMAWDNKDRSWPPLSAEDVAVIRSFQPGMRASFDALSAAGEAAEAKPYLWADGPVNVLMLLPNFRPLRELAYRSSWALLLAHHEGDFQRMLAHARNVRTLSDGSITHGQTLVSTLVSAGIETIRHHRLMEAAGHVPEHRTLEEELALWRSHRQEVRELIDRLLAPQYYERATVSGYEGEWVAAHSLRDMPGGWGIPTRNVLTAPMLDANTADLLRTYRTAWHILSEHHPYPQTIAALEEIPRPPRVASLAGLSARFAFHEFIVSHDRPAVSFARTRTSGHAAAMALATRLFEADTGRLPETLEELVPDYLPHVPADPFDADRGPMRYRVIEGLPIVYSIGHDGRDDGGSVNHSEDAYRGNLRDDYVFPLRFPPEMDYDPLEWLRKRQAALQEQP